ncbi:GntR family transcriptional regulator [Victivallis vadensis]|uniref:GntR family transcriptional regulator n=1 Tax=Victivallis vadensis TaxID=172901 RepID=UPI003AF8F4FE
MAERSMINRIREYIYTEAGGEGQFLSEREIAQKFDLKRGAVREILLSLEGEGVLERIPQKGYRYVRCDDSDPRSVEAVRYVVEREAVRKALTARTREDLVRLALILEDLDRFAAAKELEGFSRTDLEFHEQLVAASHDNMLIKMFSFLQGAAFRYQHPAFSEAFSETQACHHRIFENFKAGKTAETLEALQEHLVRWPE